MSTDRLTEFFFKDHEEEIMTERLTEMMSDPHNMSFGVLAGMRSIAATGDQAIVLTLVLVKHENCSGSQWLPYFLDECVTRLGIPKRQFSRVLAQLTAQGKLISREPTKQEEARYRRSDWEKIVMVRPEFEELERCVKVAEENA